MTKKSTSKKTTQKKTRREPRSISEVKDQMTTEQKPGWVRRWVNDIPGRIALYEDAGWNVVRDDVAVGDEGVVNQNQSLGSGARKYVGSDTYAVLMEMRKSDYDAVQKRKQKEIDESERAIHERLQGDRKYGEFTQKVSR